MGTGFPLINGEPVQGDGPAIRLRSQMTDRPFGPYNLPPNYVTSMQVSAGALEKQGWNIRGVREAVLSYTVNLEMGHTGGGYTGYAGPDWV